MISHSATDARSRMKLLPASGSGTGAAEMKLLDSFRECGHYLIAWIGRNLASEERRHPSDPRPQQQVSSRFPSFPPLTGASTPAILSEVERFLNNGVVDWGGPQSFDGD